MTMMPTMARRRKRSKLDDFFRGPSIDSYTIDRIKHIANTEVVRRLLIKYFMDKGFTESFDRQMYPAVIQDLPMVIPVLSNKLEIVPHAKEIDTSMGRAVLGWNLFVLGNQRMYLGETYHNSLHDLARQIRSGLIRVPEAGYHTARRQTTPRRVITFITRVLGDHEVGYVDLNPSTRPVMKPGELYAAKQTLMGMPQQFFTRSGYGI
jgi:hypothetical protein